MTGLNEYVDKETMMKVLEQCGRKCQSKSFVKKAQQIYRKSSNLEEFLKEFGKVYKHLHKEGDSVYIVYPRCYCSIVNKIPAGKLSPTFCNCSRGWAKALFEGALGRPIEVKMIESIKGGGKQCKFKIIL
jgi:predicted hydrocarbon binding protein